MECGVWCSDHGEDVGLEVVPVVEAPREVGDDRDVDEKNLV